MNNNDQNSIIKAEGIELNIQESTAGIDNKSTPIIRNINDFRTMEVTAQLKYDEAADVNLYTGAFYVANIRCFFIEARARFEVAGGANAAVRVEKIKSEIAAGSGTNVLAAAVSGDPHYFDLTAQASKIQWKIGTISLSALQLSPGDALTLRPSGTLTGLRHLTITCLLGYNEKDVPTGTSVSGVIAGL